MRPRGKAARHRDSGTFKLPAWEWHISLPVCKTQRGIDGCPHATARRGYRNPTGKPGKDSVSIFVWLVHGMATCMVMVNDLSVDVLRCLWYESRAIYLASTHHTPIQSLLINRYGPDSPILQTRIRKHHLECPSLITAHPHRFLVFKRTPPRRLSPRAPPQPP